MLSVGRHIAEAITLVADQFTSHKILAAKVFTYQDANSIVNAETTIDATAVIVQIKTAAYKRMMIDRPIEATIGSMIIKTTDPLVIKMVV